MNQFGLLGVFAGVAVATGIFLAAYLIFIRKEQVLKNRLLGFIFLAIALRVGKSIAFFILRDMAAIGLAIGFLGLASIGVLTYLYVSSGEAEFKPKKMHLMHAMLPIIGAIGCYFVFNTPLDSLFYQSGTAFSFIYVLLSWRTVYIQKTDNDKLKSWHVKLLATVTLVLLSFVFQHLANSLMGYAIGSGIAAIPLYYIFFQALQSPLVFTPTMRVEASQEVIDKVKMAFEERAIYRTQGITITQISEELEVPAYLITRAVKELYDKSFPDAINSFRVEEVKEKLCLGDDIKVEALAYDAGFNTPSAFYAAFKKYTGQSPKAFQQTQILQSA
ncbi:helix-turn-helix domain-containing protein [Fulvivirga lutea]|uniref:AraC family transcriptional regulator n=1 Tax=Fulvivirga lutea TaxID=2810512 RepID=A0A974WJK4_9BACT|nr:helix-turn-helix domain-containing protein [Fulvivirga lutea]QSE99139.1 AraC family transcriptional regulator [Fulvivirga lutea]